MQQPNIAIIKYSDDSFLQLDWSDGGLSTVEFSTETDDSYNLLEWNQIMFSKFDYDTNVSMGIQSFTLSNENNLNPKLMELGPEDMYELIMHIVQEEFSSDTLVHH